MNYHIVVIPHSTHRYETVGDYWIKGGLSTEIRVSDCLIAATEDTTEPYNPTKVSETVQLADRYEFLLAVHELVEAFLCRDAGIDYHAIDVFDIGYEGDGEPGDNPAAPYHAQHVIATEIEHRLADVLGVDWDKYDADLLKLAPKQQESPSI